jgi:DNA-binding NarL/FixJ family response regulator
MAIKVLLFEDNENLRKSVQTLLLWNADFDVVSARTDAITALQDIDTWHPDVILMDIDMPLSNGVDAVAQIRKANYNIPIIMFTVFEDDDHIFNAICAGANGYLLKKNFEQIPNAIIDVMNGGAPMTSSVAKKVLQFVTINKPQKNEEVENLSARETELLELIVQGFSYKMIASELKISVETVRSHVKNIYKKLQVNSATGAVYKFMQGK